MKLLRIDAGSGDHEVELIDHEDVLGPIDLGVKLHLERYESYKEDPFSPKNAIILGFGPFALSKFFGTNRVIAVFRSPVTMGLHVSSMGGAAWHIARCGVDAIAIEGKSDEPAILLIEGNGNDVNVKKEILDMSEIRRLFTPRPDGHYGTLALTEFLEKKYSDFIARNRARILVVGPAALNSRTGGIFSKVPNSEVIDSASRAGGGSVLYRAHGVLAIIAGGKKDSPRKGLEDYKKVLSEVEKKLGGPFTSVVMKATEKYRYDPSLGTGGTFGVNYVHYRELTPMLNFNSMYCTLEVRIKLHSALMNYFWRPFQDEVFRGSPSGKWATCGEPCPVACKKLWHGVKVDYEPLHAVGPMIGVFRFEDAIDLVKDVDALGVDAIEAGHTIAWIFDMIERGLAEPDDLGLPFRPRFDPLVPDIARSSHHNATLARKILLDIYYRRSEGIASEIAEKGLRRTALDLELKVPGAKDLLLYAAFGEDGQGYMTPNFYWTPGMIAPLYVLGRYWTNYTPTFQEPEDFAENSLRRAFAEYAVDNAGSCRFHRRWLEKVLDVLYSAIGVDVDVMEHSKEGYRLIAIYQRRAGAEPVPWESAKAVDLLATIAYEVGEKKWGEAISKDPNKGIEWWTRFKKRVDEILSL
jgi:glyceraldehyde-3-phosphate dehydrogenase (ferredoxin)